AVWRCIAGNRCSTGKCEGKRAAATTSTATTTALSAAATLRSASATAAACAAFSIRSARRSDSKSASTWRKGCGLTIAAGVVNIDEHESELRVIGRRTPVGSTKCRWKRDDRFCAQRARVGSAGLQLVVVPEIRAEFLDLRRHLINV